LQAIIAHAQTVNALYVFFLSIFLDSYKIGLVKNFTGTFVSPQSDQKLTASFYQDPSSKINISFGLGQPLKSVYNVLFIAQFA